MGEEEWIGLKIQLNEGKMGQKVTFPRIWEYLEGVCFWITPISPFLHCWEYKCNQTELV